MTRTTRTRTMMPALLPLLAVLLLALTLTAPQTPVAADGTASTTNTVPNAPIVPFNTGKVGSSSRLYPGTIDASVGTNISPFDPNIFLAVVAAHNLQVKPGITGVEIVFDTAPTALRTILNVHREINPAPFGDGTAIDPDPVIAHTLVLTNLAPATAYRYSISDGKGNEIASGRFVTLVPSLSYLGVQPGTNSAVVVVDLAPATPFTLVFDAQSRREPEIRSDVAAGAHVVFNQTGLHVGTDYKVRVLVNGLYVGQAYFKTGVTIDAG